jgi:hypothetical protein
LRTRTRTIYTHAAMRVCGCEWLRLRHNTSRPRLCEVETRTRTRTPTRTHHHRLRCSGAGTSSSQTLPSRTHFSGVAAAKRSRRPRVWPTPCQRCCQGPGRRSCRHGPVTRAGVWHARRWHTPSVGSRLRRASRFPSSQRSCWQRSWRRSVVALFRTHTRHSLCLCLPAAHARLSPSLVFSLH